MRAALAQWGGRHGVRLLAIAFFIPAALLFAPVLYYSLDTPFGLVDDYSDWKYSIIFTSPALFLDWIDFTFLGTDILRYRPFWDFYNATTWSVFGTNPWLHHLSRWVFHFAAILMFALAFLRFARPEGKDGVGKTWTISLIPVAFLVYVWMFFPNSPASRLSPQEVYTVFFLGMCTLAVAWTLRSGDHTDWIRSDGIKYSLFLLGYTGLVLSKEVNVAVALWLLLVYISYASISRDKRKILTGALPIIFLFIFTTVRVSVASDSYNSSFSPGSFTSHALFIAKGIFQSETSLFVTIVFSILFITSIASIILKRRFASDRPFVLFLLGQMISLYLIFSLSSQDITMRYWYPLLPSFILMLAFSVKYVLIYCRGISLMASQISASLLVIFTLFFVMINYYDFANQTLAQHSAKKSDETILAEISGLRTTGNYVYSNPQIEQEDSLFFYFSEYLPFFSGSHYDTASWAGWPYVIDISFVAWDNRIHSQPPSDPDDPYFLIVHRQGNIIFDFLDTHAIASAKDDYVILSHARALAGFLQGKHPHVSVDHGAIPVDAQWDGRYEWAIYRVPFGDPLDRIADSLRTAYEQAVSADPVARAGFNLYSSEGRLVYVRERCTPQDTRDVTMYLHVTPADTASLPERTRALGFDNLDFPFETRGASFDGRCVAVVQLPDYAIASIRTGQYPGEEGGWDVEFVPGLDEFLRVAYEQAKTSTPIVRSTFDLHVIENQLVYVRERCAPDDTDDWFFLHLMPVDTGDLPGARRRHGFDNRDFGFALRGSRFDGRCVAAMPLPDYPIASIRTGQYGDAGDIWSVEFAPER